MVDLWALFAGGGTGLLGGIINKGFGIVENWQERKAKAADRAHELMLLDKQSAMMVVEKEMEMTMAQQKYDAETLKNSYVHDMKSGQGSQWVVNTLRMFRPSITAGLVVLVGLIYFYGLPEQDVDSKAQIIDTVLYMFSASVLWWFGSRPHSKK